MCAHATTPRALSREVTQHARLRRARAMQKKNATARALSLGRGHSTRACGVRAPRRAGLSRSMFYGSPLRQRDGPLPRSTAALRRASWGLHTAFLRMCAGKNATARALSLGRRRSTRACGVRAPRRADWSWSMRHGSPLRQRNGPLRRRKAVLRRTSCGVQYATGSRMCARKTPPRALFLSGGGELCVLAARARRAASVAGHPHD